MKPYSCSSFYFGDGRTSENSTLIRLYWY